MNPIAPAFRSALTYRIYFNRWNDFPLVWSVDDGSQASEMNVVEVVFDGVSGRTARGKGDNLNSPTVWIEVEGYLDIQDQVATISREPKPLKMPSESWVLPSGIHGMQTPTQSISSAAGGSR